MFRIFGLVIMTKKEEEKIVDHMVKQHENFCEMSKMALDARLDEMQKEEERHALAMGAINLRDDIMRLDVDEHEWYIVNAIMNLIDKHFGEECIPEEDVKTPEIKFGGF